MDKVINKVKVVRYNWWEAFKEFVRLPGYHYHKMPPELKYRYPAPGSVPKTPQDRPYLFKQDWKQSFKDSPFNIRPKELKEDFMEMTEHYISGRKHELDPNKEMDRMVLEGPVRNRDREPSPHQYIEEVFDPLKTTREERAKQVRAQMEKNPEIFAYNIENFHPAQGPGYQENYFPTYALFNERAATPVYNDQRLQHTFLELEYYIAEIMGKERIETKEMSMYKGTPKKWQVLDDQQFSRDQIEKIQVAIHGPNPDELERYQEESDVKMKLPITNQNVSEWRDKKRAIDTADFNAKLVEFERKRHDNYFLKRYERPKKLNE